ncbi:hypothetical protein FS749_003104 [Ceratobasidium sp. UAMH 11750]|nr:hypothetical protein FS749_003104 [Ceratobasidium sp. UAMH 11750]
MGNVFELIKFCVPQNALRQHIPFERWHIIWASNAYKYFNREDGHSIMAKTRETVALLRKSLADIP